MRFIYTLGSKPRRTVTFNIAPIYNNIRFFNPFVINTFRNNLSFNNETIRSFKFNNIISIIFFMIFQFNFSHISNYFL